MELKRIINKRKIEAASSKGIYKYHKDEPDGIIIVNRFFLVLFLIALCYYFFY